MILTKQTFTFKQQQQQNQQQQQQKRTEKMRTNEFEDFKNKTQSNAENKR